MWWTGRGARLACVVGGEGGEAGASVVGEEGARGAPVWWVGKGGSLACVLSIETQLGVPPRTNHFLNGSPADQSFPEWFTRGPIMS